MGSMHCVERNIQKEWLLAPRRFPQSEPIRSQSDACCTLHRDWLRHPYANRNRHRVCASRSRSHRCNDHTDDQSRAALGDTLASRVPSATYLRSLSRSPPDFKPSASVCSSSGKPCCDHGRTTPVCNPCLIGYPARHQCGPRWRTNRLNIVGFQPRTATCKSIELRCLDLATMPPNISPSQVIGHNEDYVRPRRILAKALTRTDQYQQSCSNQPKSHDLHFHLCSIKNAKSFLDRTS